MSAALSRMNATAAIHPAFRRFPALARAALYGVVVEIAPGVRARLQLVVRDGAVYVPVQTSGVVQTPFGPARVQGSAIVSASLETFGAALDAAERHGLVPKLSMLLGGNAGRPLLNLPR